MGKIDDILVGLTERTDEGRLKWRTSADPDRFVAAVGDIAVVVSLVEQQGLGRDERFRLEILNDQGVTVEAIETIDSFGLIPAHRRATDEQAHHLDRLFTLARRSALDVDSTLDELVNNLGAIG